MHKKAIYKNQINQNKNKECFILTYQHITIDELMGVRQNLLVNLICKILSY